MNWRSRSSLAWRSENACSSRSSMRLSATPSAADLSALVGGLDAAGEVAGRDLAGGWPMRSSGSRLFRTTTQATAASTSRMPTIDQALDDHEPAERLLRLGERDGDDRDLARAELGGDEPVAVVVGAPARHGLGAPRP